jgi:hypothetical protein
LGDHITDRMRQLASRGRGGSGVAAAGSASVRRQSAASKWWRVMAVSVWTRWTVNRSQRHQILIVDVSNTPKIE